MLERPKLEMGAASQTELVSVEALWYNVSQVVTIWEGNRPFLWLVRGGW